MKPTKIEGCQTFRRFRLIGSDGAFLGWIHRTDLAQAEDAMLEFGVSVEEAESEEREEQTLGFARRSSFSSIGERNPYMERQLAQFLDRATKALGSEEKASHWLNTPNAALGHAVPVSMLSSGAGAKAVEALLTRIEHGVFS